MQKRKKYITVGDNSWIEVTIVVASACVHDYAEDRALLFPSLTFGKVLREQNRKRILREKSAMSRLRRLEFHC